MAEWRITEENPIRYDAECMDHERCAALHNYIIELGWTQQGHSLSALDKRTWWEYYSGDAALASISKRLHPSVVLFLKTAWLGFDINNGNTCYSVHRYLAYLSKPDELFEIVLDYEDEERCITLYKAPSFRNHPLGLVLDQYSGNAIQHLSMHDKSFTLNGRLNWLPIEFILDGLIEMIDQGKVVAVGDDYQGKQERCGPWIMPSYTQLDLDETLQAFEHLVNVIYAKMPSQPQKLDENLLNIVTGGCPQSLHPDSFAYRFLAQSSRPSFTYIAPGLRIAQHQPFASASTEAADRDKLYPLVLFSSTHPAHRETIITPWGQEIPDFPYHDSRWWKEKFTPNLSSNLIEPPQSPPPDTYPAGLYLTETNPHCEHPFEDGCRLFLPFPLGANAYARTSDGAFIGEHRTQAGDGRSGIQVKSTELYQAGYNHFIGGHDVQLKFVLWNWANMIEEGKWGVDADGVVGGVEKWKEADTEEFWSDYQLGFVTW